MEKKVRANRMYHSGAYKTTNGLVGILRSSVQSKFQEKQIHNFNQNKKSKMHSNLLMQIMVYSNHKSH